MGVPDHPAQHSFTPSKNAIVLISDSATCVVHICLLWFITQTVLIATGVQKYIYVCVCWCICIYICGHMCIYTLSLTLKDTFHIVWILLYKVRQRI